MTVHTNVINYENRALNLGLGKSGDWNEGFHILSHRDVLQKFCQFNEREREGICESFSSLFITRVKVMILKGLEQKYHTCAMVQHALAR